MSSEAATWRYQNLDGKWTEYSSVLNKKIEGAFQKGERLVQVDKTWYIDLDAKPFHQRRHDDYNQCRRIKRIAPRKELLVIWRRDLLYVELSSFIEESQALQLVEEISIGGGLVAARLSPKVSIIVIYSGSDAQDTETHRFAREHSVPIVSEEYVYECMAIGARQPVGNEMEVQRDRAPSKSGSSSREQLGDDDGANDITDGNHANGSGSGEEDDEQVLDDNDIFRKQAVLKGVCYSPFEFVMKIDRRRGAEIFGTMTWDCFDSTTRFRGRVENGSIKFEEYQAVAGDGVSLPSFYTGAFTATGAAGVVPEDEGALEGKWELYRPR